MKRIFGSLLTLVVTIAASYGEITEYANGRAGIALKNAFRIHCAPKSYKSISVDVLRTLYSIDEKYVMDGMSNTQISIAESEIMYIVPPAWMNASVLEFNRISMDLHNLILTESTIAVDRGILPFALVSEPEKHHGRLSIGFSVFRNDMIQAAEPQDEMKGDIARAIFYITTVYPVPLWTSWGSFFFDNNPYPTLCNEATDLYLKWHREDPVDNAEMERCMKIYDLQGNVNPFITNPEIAEYLWGDRAGEIYSTGSHQAPRPLKHTYSKLYDKYITLSSPYLPHDTRWWLDKKEASERIPTSALTLGKHELRFATDDSCGKLIITITQ